MNPPALEHLGTFVPIFL